LANVLELTATELSQIANGFNQIRIGNTGNGLITGEGTVTFQDPLQLQTVLGSIDLTDGTLIGTDNASLSLRAGQDLRTSDLSTNGQAITLVSTNGAIDTSLGTLTSSGGTLSLQAPGTITTGNLTSRATTGGAITIMSGTGITAGAIDSSGIGLDGGDVLLDPPGDIQVASINAQGGDSGVGGSVDITTASLFRATDTFSDRNGLLASISTAGGSGGGAITIRHGGSNLGTVFSVAVAGTPLLNGTLGTITSGDFTFPSGSYDGNFSVTEAGLSSENRDIGIRPNLNLVTVSPSPLGPPNIGPPNLDPTDAPREGDCPPNCAPPRYPIPWHLRLWGSSISWAQPLGIWRRN
jgi:hypothetical protein